ncbi:TetR family transcriptional regulator [Lederbergia ruris]|uniref:TetR family transcriptional regulator n=1 Tax=Lederbergia ruris TaxID=217495 RepID=A0ABQ4KQ17_9BACI|nr:TetR/AcrR family transcriptional regulator [Lederbergia ruris]MBW8350572.1 TetR/AcrR family transcriptional regulator [Bacillus sp. IITD106]GIN59548.1 TetR family transcriptional regulator [Lederbergia ruris]
MKLSTKDKIVEAMVELVHEKGYKGATTRELAQIAGVNEVTIFRIFGNKKGIVDAIIQKYALIDLIESIFQEKVVWDIEKDLKMLVREYQALLEQKRTVILLSLKETGQFADLDELLKRIPRKYTEIITDYFTKMIEKGKMNTVDSYVIATNFVFINFGYFLMKTKINSEAEELSIDDFIDKNINSFIKMLQ